MGKVKRRVWQAVISASVALACAACRAPVAAVVAECEPVPADKLHGVNTVLVMGNFPTSEPRKTDDPHLVLAVLAALEHGMVDDPRAEARIRMEKPYNGMVGLESRRVGKPGHNLRTIYFDATEFRSPRYRKEFVDAVTAAYRAGKDVPTYDSEHSETPVVPQPKSPKP